MDLPAGTVTGGASVGLLALLRPGTGTGCPAERPHRSADWTPIGSIPDHAADPGRMLRPTTIHCKRIPATAPTR
ncbi:hypothetical protein ACIQU3_05695 [Streptomyces sp. NPDC101110]|uniref:hypothetical protein n=1 Tax=unclassified Streptomyces TaxID=2593676 RepID=UPI00380176A8